MGIVKIHFYKGDSLIAKIIKWRTYSPYSHVSLQIGHDIYESKEGIGVRKIKARLTPPLSLKKTLYFDLTTEEENELRHWLENRLGSKYDYSAVFGFWGLPKPDKDPKKYICSEYAYRALLHAKKVPIINHMISPGSLYLLCLKK